MGLSIPSIERRESLVSGQEGTNVPERRKGRPARRQTYIPIDVRHMIKRRAEAAALSFSACCYAFIRLDD